MSRYVCVGAVMAPKSRKGQPTKIYKPKTFLPDDYPAHLIKEHMASGHIKEVNLSGIVVAQEAPPVKMYPKWRHDPAGLSKRTLKGLNALIAETDVKHPLAQSKREAIAILSQDYEAALAL